MNDDDVISDLKQFISAVVAQESSGLREDIQNLDEKLSTKIVMLDAKIDGLSAALAKP